MKNIVINDIPLVLGKVVCEWKSIKIYQAYSRKDEGSYYVGISENDMFLGNSLDEVLGEYTDGYITKFKLKGIY